MRYWAVRITDPSSGSVMTFSDAAGKFVANPAAAFTWSSHTAAGLVDPAAPLIELDIPSLPFGTFQGGAYLKLWGPSLAALGQASNLNGFNVEVLGGVKAPFNDLNANAKPGQLLYGQVYQGLGNWEGVNQYLQLMLINASVNPDLEADISFNWTAGMDLGTAITNALQGAFPTYTVVTNILRFVQDHDEPGHYDDLTAFAEYLLEKTQTATYSGVQIRGAGSTIYVYDNTLAAVPTAIQFSDIIGQPTWIGPAAISFACVMRADLALAGQVSLPTGIFAPYTLTAPQAAIPGAVATQKLGFQGTFTLTEVHHYGNSRQADGESWRTVYVAAPNT